jgi:hypothetical protein
MAAMVRPTRVAVVMNGEAMMAKVERVVNVGGRNVLAKSSRGVTTETRELLSVINNGDVVEESVNNVVKVGKSKEIVDSVTEDVIDNIDDVVGTIADKVDDIVESIVDRVGNVDVEVRVGVPKTSRRLVTRVGRDTVKPNPPTRAKRATVMAVESIVDNVGESVGVSVDIGIIGVRTDDMVANGGTMEKVKVDSQAKTGVKRNGIVEATAATPSSSPRGQLRT